MTGRPKIALVADQNDAVMGVAGEPAALIPLSQIDAVCLSVEKRDYTPYRQLKWRCRVSLRFVTRRIDYRRALVEALQVEGNDNNSVFR
jgi:hypothetical protein